MVLSCLSNPFGHDGLQKADMLFYNPSSYRDAVTSDIRWKKVDRLYGVDAVVFSFAI